MFMSQCVTPGHSLKSLRTNTKAHPSNSPTGFYDRGAVTVVGTGLMLEGAMTFLNLQKTHLAKKFVGNLILLISMEFVILSPLPR